jgi:pimeloyl-ACP methyl ester carboxylesterase
MAAISSGHGRLKWRHVPLLVAVVGSLAGRPVDTATAAAPTGPAVPELRWSSCYQRFQCATVRVPLDYDRPRGALISLALIRLPASGPGAKIGSIFLNPGGPGGSGVDLVRDAGPALFSSEVRARFDLVGFDPRGIRRSTPLRCFESLREARAALPPFPFPVTPQEERIQVESDRAVAAACEDRGGPILNHMATADVARDMNLLRRAVGDRRLTYAGASYGSYLGATYANLFPKRVRAVIVDAVLDPIAWATGRRGESETLPFSTRVRADQGSWPTLKEFFRLCDRFAANCAFSEGDPQERFARLAERLRKDPVVVPDGQGGTIEVTYNLLVAVTLGAMYEPAVWPQLAELLAEVETLSRADAGASLLALRTRLGAFQNYPNFVEGGPGVACSETENPDDISAWPRAARESDEDFPYFGRPWTWFSSICLPWPGLDADRYMGPFDARTSEPVLIVGNTFDPATRYQGAVRLARLLPNSRLLTLDGWGHTALFRSACIDSYTNDYLLTSRVPPVGTVCTPDVTPFAQPAGQQARDSASQSPSAVLVPPVIRRAIGN